MLRRHKKLYWEIHIGKLLLAGFAMCLSNSDTLHRNNWIFLSVIFISTFVTLVIPIRWEINIHLHIIMHMRFLSGPPGDSGISIWILSLTHSLNSTTFPLSGKFLLLRKLWHSFQVRNWFIWPIINYFIITKFQKVRVHPWSHILKPIHPVSHQHMAAFYTNQDVVSQLHEIVFQ